MKETSRFYSSLGLLIVLNAIVKPLWIFGIDRMVQNSVGTFEYGKYFALLNFSIVFSFLLDWGFTSFFNRQLASQEKNFIDHAGNFLFVKFLFLLLYAAVVFLVAWAAHIQHWDILLGVVSIQALQSLFIFFRGVITAHQWFRTDAWLSVLDKTLMIILCGILLTFPVLFGSITIDIFLIVQVSCSLLAMFTAWFIIQKNGIRFIVSKTAFFQKKIFKSALPFASIVLLMSAHYRFDGFLLAQIHPDGAHEAGVYAAAYRLLDAANMIGVLLASFLLPYIARQWSEKKDITGIVLTSRHFLILFSIAIATITFFLAPWIQKLLYHHDDTEAIQVMQWCLPSLIGYSLVQVYGTVMTATGHILSFCYITLVAVLINITLNVLLIPHWGARGSCFAALISQGFCGIAVMLYVWKKSAVVIHLRSLIIYIFTAALSSGFLYWGNGLGINPPWLMAGVALISMAALFTSGMHQWKQWLISFRKTEFK